MTAPQPHVEIAGIDAFLVRLGEAIDPALIPWVRAAALRLRERLGDRLVEVVPSCTTSSQARVACTRSPSTTRRRSAPTSPGLPPAPD